MLPFLTERFANPQRLARRVPRRPARGRRGPRRRRRGPRRCAGRGRVHGLRHRGGQPRRARHGPAPWRRGRVLGRRAPRRAARGRARRAVGSCPSTRPARSTSTHSPTRSTRPSRVVSVMAVNNEVGTISAAGRGGRPRAGAGPGRGAPHRRRAGPPVARPGRRWQPDFDLVAVSAHKFGGPKGVGALLVRGSTAVEPLLDGRRPGARPAQRHATTSPGSSPWPRPCGSPSPTRTETVARVAGPAGSAGRRARSRAVPGLRRDRAPRPEGGRLGPRLRRGRRERGAPVPARSRRRLRLGRVRRAPAGRWTRPTSSPPWACRGSWPAARCGSRSAGRRRDDDVDRVLEVRSSGPPIARAVRSRRRGARRMSDAPRVAREGARRP